MQTTGTTKDKAERLKRRRTTRRALFGFTLLCAAFLAAAFWLNKQQNKQQSQEAAQFQRDCMRPSATSPDCQLLPMQVYEHKEEGFLDPDSEEAHLWLGLQSKSGQKFEVDTYGPQWHRLSVGDQVTALVWNGEVEEVTDSGGTERMTTNPARAAEETGNYLFLLKFMALATLVSLLVPIGVGKLREKRERISAGNVGVG